MRFLPLASLICLWPAAAGAIDDREFKSLTPILAPKPGAKICFARHYDPDHLRAHPRQKVTDLTLLLRVRGYDKTGETATADAERIAYEFALSARRRADRKALTATGDCAGAEKARCAVECDGGGFDLAKSGEGVALKLSGEGVGLENDCDTSRGVFIAPGADDRVFQLEPAPDAACAPLEKKVLGR
ncbi:hypothetical protein GJ654_11035 [Rhodoblastus acidophilus]|uniref:Uncharacterized protein n=1 Tax=Rhodoblastus acidophilus TaxID=1074 RepID=A0A6N8DLX3_RHOAC|nr:hypothetical protein [Rhodoblastus acidophilus]MCW2274886.1 hypothetical protein [Rhodoblastus acidophilus]MTV31530.1 hypothetical protein [Rhodoblastus acidophilus]